MPRLPWHLLGNCFSEAFRNMHRSDIETIFGSDFPIGTHFSETHALCDLWAQNCLNITRVESLGYPLARTCFGSVFSLFRAFFRLSVAGILYPRVIGTRAPDLNVSLLKLFLIYRKPWVWAARSHHKQHHDFVCAKFQYKWARFWGVNSAPCGAYR